MLDASGCRRASIGSAKAAVLPVPVWACPITSWPLSSVGIVAAWMGVGVSYPRAVSVRGQALRKTQGQERRDGGAWRRR
jgi:hypothetical protein